MSHKPSFLIQLASSAKVAIFGVEIVAKAIPHSMMQKRCLLSGFATGTLAPLQLFALMWSSPDVIGLFSNNVVSFSRNVVLSGLSFSLNVVWKRAMLSVRAVYVLSSPQLVC
jgi:hypothetical protein